MKRIFFSVLFALILSASAYAQSTVPLTIQEVDGSPKKTMPSKLVFPAGSLVVSGSSVFVSLAALGGGTVTHTAGALTANAFILGNGTDDVKALALTGLILGNGASAPTALTTSAGIAGAISNETGSSLLVFNTSPQLVTPEIHDTSSDHQYIIAVSELAADRTVTLPLLAGNDTFVFASFTQTLANKTLTTPTIASFTNATHDHTNAAGGGQLNATSVFSAGTVPVARLPLLVGDSGSGGTAGLVPAPASGDAAAGKFLKADGTWEAPAGGGGTIDGSGAASRVAYWSDTDTLTSDAAFTFNGTAAMLSGATLGITSSDVAAFFVGANGATNPAFLVKADVASSATGISVTARAAGAGVDITALSSGSNEGIQVNPKGSGQFTVGGGGIGLGLKFEVNGSIGASNVIGTLRGGGWAFEAGTTVNGVTISSDYHYKWGSTEDANNAPDTGVTRDAAAVVRVTDGSAGAGSLIVGSSSAAVGTSGVAVLVLENGTPPSSSPANLVQIYSEGGEAKVRDAAGNITPFSPHHFSGIPDGASEPLAWAFHSERSGVSISIDMLRVVRMLEFFTGEQLVFIRDVKTGLQIPTAEYLRRFAGTKTN